jgi:hypothetical protein
MIIDPPLAMAVSIRLVSKNILRLSSLEFR